MITDFATNFILDSCTNGLTFPLFLLLICVVGGFSTGSQWKNGQATDPHSIAEQGKV